MCGREAAYNSFGTRDGQQLYILGIGRELEVNQALAALCGLAEHNDTGLYEKVEGRTLAVGEGAAGAYMDFSS